VIVVGYCQCGEAVSIDYPERALERMRRHVEEAHPGEPPDGLIEFRHRSVLIPPGTLIGSDGQWRLLA